MLSAKTSHIEKIANSLKKKYPDNPLLKTMRRRWQDIQREAPLEATEASTDGPKPAWQKRNNTYDYLTFLNETGREDSKEAWEEFKKRTGVTFK